MALPYLKRAAPYYDRLFLDRPVWVLVALFLLALLAGYFAQSFRLDASADSLIVERDPALQLYRTLNERFGTAEFLVLTYEPASGTIFDNAHLKNIGDIESAIEKIPGVTGVTTMLDVPLVRSPPAPSFAEMINYVRSLRDPTTNRDLAKDEILNSPLFRGLLISEDGKATAMQIDLANDPELARLFRERNVLRDMMERTPEQEAQLAALHEEYVAMDDVSRAKRHELIKAIRVVAQSHRDDALLYLGGVPMIVDDMITYVQNDLATFGSGVLLIITIMLFVFFRAIRWVLLPLVASFLCVLYMVGLLGFVDWPVTVVSSNFVSLLIIVSISLSIHLVTQYREIAYEEHHLDRRALVQKTVYLKVMPCIYTALTTMVGFGSLLTSGILPVNHFGLIMVMGVFVCLFVNFAFLPSVMMLLRKRTDDEQARAASDPLSALAEVAAKRPWSVIAVSGLLGVACLHGISKLSLENSFVEYFNEDTEIHQGLKYIDEKLGGTMPMDVIIHFPPFVNDVAEDDDFATEEKDPERYWYTREKLEELTPVHEYLDSLPETGKVLSLATLDQLIASFNNGERLDSLTLQLIYGGVPEVYRETLVGPYADPYTGVTRIAIRIRESDPNLRRDEFLKRIEAHISNDLGFGDRVQVSGMVVLFNNMLSQLFTSQISTLAGVLGVTVVMFWTLFRRLRLALIGVLPNVLAAALVLSIMGWMGIPLDIMTITIASICIGIGVDNAIHYIYRFDREMDESGDPMRAVRETHLSIGRALYFTTLTVLAGFSILIFSAFNPTIYFGLFTALAMVIALIANLTFLPAMLLVTGVRMRTAAKANPATTA